MQTYYHRNLARDAVTSIYLHTTVANRDKNAEEFTLDVYDLRPIVSDMMSILR